MLGQPHTEAQQMNCATAVFAKHHGQDALKAKQTWHAKTEGKTRTNCKAFWKKEIHALTKVSTLKQANHFKINDEVENEARSLQVNRHARPPSREPIAQRAKLQPDGTTFGATFCHAS